MAPSKEASRLGKFRVPPNSAAANGKAQPKKKASKKKKVLFVFLYPFRLRVPLSCNILFTSFLKVFYSSFLTAPI